MGVIDEQISLLLGPMEPIKWSLKQGFKYSLDLYVPTNFTSLIRDQYGVKISISRMKLLLYSFGNTRQYR